MDERELERALAALHADQLVAFPTETVYGLGAAAESLDALTRLFAAKGRPTTHPVIVHGADATVLERYGHGFPPSAEVLASAFWPGPLTLVVPRSSRVPDAVSGGQDTVGVRVPDHPLALALLGAFGSGVAAPSANRFGRVSPTSADAVRAELADAVEVVLDGGAPAIGIESTVLDLTSQSPTVLRPGAVSAGDLESVLGGSVERAARGDGPRAPGRMPVHYAPSAEVELIGFAELPFRAADLVRSGARIAVISPDSVTVPGAVFVADRLDHGAKYARELYASLRQSDAAGVNVVLAVPPTGTALSEAILDRLERAAGPKPR